MGTTGSCRIGRPDRISLAPVMESIVAGPQPVQKGWKRVLHRRGAGHIVLLCLIGLGFAVAGLALRFGESVEIIANLLEIGLLGICAFFFPFSFLPPMLQTIARLIPLSYAVDAFRTVSLGETQPELLSLNIELAIVITTGLLSPLLGYLIYVTSENKVRQQGTL